MGLRRSVQPSRFWSGPVKELGDLVELLPSFGPLQIPAVLGLEIFLFFGILEQVLAVVPALVVAVKRDATYWPAYLLDSPP